MSAPSSKISHSDRIAMMKLDLKIAGHKLDFNDDTNDDRIIELHNKLRADAERRAAEAQQRRQADLRREQLERDRECLKRRGVDADSLSESEVRDRLNQIRIEDQRREQIWRAELEARQTRERIESEFKATKCPHRHVVNLDKIDAEKTPKWFAIRDTLEEGIDAGGLFALLGKRGTGKTQLAVSLMHRAANRLATQCHIVGRYTTAIELLRRIRASFGRDNRGEGESETQIIRELTTCGVLVIDELHQRAGSEFEQNMLTNIIDTRYREMRFTLLIANMTPREFAAGVGDSVVSRIHECGECITANWPTFRVPGRWKNDVEASTDDR
jgi:DNA replication protein DnaC